MMVLLTLVMIVFCELAPKIFAAVHAESVALGCAYIYRVLLWVSPGRWSGWRTAWRRASCAWSACAAAATQTQALSTDELRTVVAEAGPLVPQRHRQMLLSILDLERVSVNDIMIPRQEIVGHRHRGQLGRYPRTPAAEHRIRDCQSTRRNSPT